MRTCYTPRATYVCMCMCMACATTSRRGLKGRVMHIGVWSTCAHNTACVRTTSMYPNRWCMYSCRPGSYAPRARLPKEGVPPVAPPFHCIRIPYVLHAGRMRCACVPRVLAVDREPLWNGTYPPMHHYTHTLCMSYACMRSGVRIAPVHGIWDPSTDPITWT